MLCKVFFVYMCISKERKTLSIEVVMVGAKDRGSVFHSLSLSSRPPSFAFFSIFKFERLVMEGGWRTNETEGVDSGLSSSGRRMYMLHKRRKRIYRMCESGRVRVGGRKDM